VNACSFGVAAFEIRHEGNENILRMQQDRLDWSENNKRQDQCVKNEFNLLCTENKTEQREHYFFAGSALTSSVILLLEVAFAVPAASELAPAAAAFGSLF